MEYQTDYILRLIEQMGGLIRRAFERFRGGGSDAESIELVHQAIGLVVDMDPVLFLRLSPQSMVSFLEISGFDDRVVTLLAEAIELQAEVEEGEGDLVLADVRRSQAAALRAATDPARAN